MYVDVTDWLANCPVMIGMLTVHEKVDYVMFEWYLEATMVQLLKEF